MEYHLNGIPLHNNNQKITDYDRRLAIKGVL